MKQISPEELAQMFHEAYERLASQYGYGTRPESAKPWEEVPEANKQLMIAVASVILQCLQAERKDMMR